MDTEITEARLKHKMRWPKHKKKHNDEESDIPKSYSVPDFGLDRDIVNTEKHLGDAQKRLNHKWIVQKYRNPDPPVMGYDVPNFGQDRDITASLHNVGVAEDIVGHKWNKV